MFFTVALIVVSVVHSSSLTFSEVEYEALREIFTSTGGDNWTWKDGPGKPWDFSVYENPCTEHWQGIACSVSVTQNTSHVSQLVLPDYGLVGHLPDSIGNFSMMQRMVLKNNSLSGAFPSYVGNLVSLKILNMNTNAFSQSLPHALGKLTKLSVLDFLDNQLTGTVPQFLIQSPELRYLDLYGNHLTGSIPAFLGNLQQIRYFYLGSNNLDGSLPRGLGDLRHVIDFYVDNNNLQGIIPSEYSNLQSIVYFDATDNMLSGGLSGVFDPSMQKNLTMVLLSNNQLTGTLPDAVFLLPQLEVLDAGSNCLVNNPLSSAVCSSARLRTLALNGLHTSPACRKKILSRITSTYMLFTSLRGGVPDCIYSLPSLETLYMSSNGLTGSLPEKVNFGPNFTDLGVSRNFLTGSIPQKFQTHRWSNLDLSYNKIGGTLSANFSVVSPHAYLSLRNNKLSGKIPDSIVHAPSAVSVIEGNWFACKQDKSDLPKNDQYVEQYQCGSNSFNLAYYVWLSTFLLMLCSGMLFVARRNGHAVSFATTLGTLIPNAQKAIDVFQIKLNAAAFPGLHYPQGSLQELGGSDIKDFSSLKYYLRHYYRVSTLCKLLLRMCIVLTVYIVLVLLPLYGILSTYYGTLTHQYAYQLSAAFTSGIVALVLCMFFLMIVPVIAYVSFVFFFREHDAACNVFDREIDFDEQRSRNDSTSSVDSSRTVLYIKQSKSLAFAALICTNAVVVIGANVGFVIMVQYVNRTTASLAQVALSVFKVGWSWICCNTTYHIDQELGQYQTNLKNGLFSALCVITVFNSIVVPCLVVMAISSTCFYNAFVPSESVKSSFSFNECVYFEQTGCASYTTRVAQSSIQPPFVYSYQCADTILTYYAPSFVYVCFIQGLLIPFVRWTVPSLLVLFPKLTRFHRLMRWFVPKILRPVPETRYALPSTSSPYFDARSFLVQIVNYLAVIMTFGVVFPPVAICTVLTIVSSGFFAHLEVKKFLKDAANKGAVKFIEHVDRECMCMGTSAMLMHTIMLLITISCIFYSIFLFDILGDQMRFQRSYWVVLVLVFEPLFLFCIYEAYIGSSFVRARLWVIAVLSGRSTKADHVVKVFHETPSPLVDDVSIPCEVEMSTL